MIRMNARPCCIHSYVGVVRMGRALKAALHYWHHVAVIMRTAVIDSCCISLSCQLVSECNMRDVEKNRWCHGIILVPGSFLTRKPMTNLNKSEKTHAQALSFSFSPWLLVLYGIICLHSTAYSIETCCASQPHLQVLAFVQIFKHIKQTWCLATWFKALHFAFARKTTQPSSLM